MVPFTDLDYSWHEIAVMSNVAQNSRKTLASCGLFMCYGFTMGNNW
jgi:hypothetical protein